MEREFYVDGHKITLDVRDEGDTTVVVVDGRSLEVERFDFLERYLMLTIDGRSYRIPYARAADRLHVGLGGHDFSFHAAGEDDAEEGAGTHGGFAPEVISPMPGKVLEVLVAEGDTVEAEQALVLLEAMKMEQSVRAPAAATVVRVEVKAGAMVGPGEILVLLEPLDAQEEQAAT